MRGFCPEQQQDQSPHGVHTVVVVADEADEIIKLVNLRRLGSDGRWRGAHESSMNILKAQRETVTFNKESSKMIG